MVLDTVQVHAMRGKSVLLWRGQRLVLKPGTEFEENQPVEVAAGAALRLRLGQRALLDLGPNARFVVLKLARDGEGQARVTRLRLERGFLRVVASDQQGDLPIDVLFGPWSARIGEGENFFESGDVVASACSTNGSIELQGLPHWKPRSASAPCVMLEPQRAPVEISLEQRQWEFLRRNRRLYPTLASIAQQSAASAVARMDQDASRIAPAPHATAADGASGGDERSTTAAAQALLDSAPPAAGPGPSQAPPAPALKWSDRLGADPSQAASAAPVAASPRDDLPVDGKRTGIETAASSGPSGPDVDVEPMAPLEAEHPEWIVNVATYADSELAQRHVQQLTATGFKAAVRQEAINSRASYRVVIESLPSESAAKSVVADLGARYGVRTAWAMRKR